MKPTSIAAILSKRYVSFDDLRGLRARGYVRDSTKDQAEGFSPDVQRNREQAFAQEHQLVWQGIVYEEYVSGRSVLKRSQFQQAVQDAEDGLYDALLVFHTSRFARNTPDAREYKRRLRAAGVMVVFVQQGIVSGAKHTRLAERFNEVLDEEYSESVSLWTSEGWRGKFETADMLGTPFAYRRNRAGRLVPDLRQLPCVGVEGTYTAWETVRAIGHRYLMTIHSDAAIARWGNDQGWRNQKGEPFNRESIRYLLTSPENAGFATYHKKRDNDDCEKRLVPGLKAPWRPEEYEQIQRIRRARSAGKDVRKGTKRRWYPLAGAEHGCGERFIGLVVSGKYRRNVRQVVCRAHRFGVSRADHCPAGPIDCEPLERLVGQQLQRCSLDARDRAAIVSRMQTLKQQPASDTRTTLAGRLKRLEEMYEMGHIERNEYLAKRQIVEGELDALPANVSAFNLQRAASRLDAMAGLWAKASDELRYQFVAEVFKRKRIEGKTLYLWPKPEYVPFLQPVLEQYDHQCGPEGIRTPGLQRDRLAC